MADYWLRVFEFCKEEPGWAIAFFFCGFVIGETYFMCEFSKCDLEKL